MYKKAKSNKGFTLLELIIAISIFSIVIVMGYRVINESSRATAKQTEVFNEQQAANLVNKYLTKDLEMCKKKEDMQDTELESYKNKYDNIYGYTLLDNQENRINYIVGIKDTSYELIRKDNNSEIIIAEKLAMNSENSMPFIISEDNESKQNSNTEEENTLYTVNISNLDEVYSFKINPRYTAHEGINKDGHIILHTTGSDKSIIINSTSESNNKPYEQKIKVSKSNDEKTVKIYMDNQEFKIYVENYENGIMSGNIDLNDYSHSIENINLNQGIFQFTKDDLKVLIEMYNEDGEDDDDDSDDDDDEYGYIVKIQKNNSSLVSLRKDDDDDDIKVILYNNIDIEFDDEEEVELKIGNINTDTLSTRDDDDEFEIKIAGSYMRNVYGASVEGYQINIDEVELNDDDLDSWGDINLDNGENLDLEIEGDYSSQSENMVIVKFDYEERRDPIEQIYGDIKIERIGKNNQEQKLEITYENGEKEYVNIGSPKGQYPLSLEIETNRNRKETKIKLLPISETIVVRTEKRIKLVEVHGKGGNSANVKPNQITSMGPFELNPGGDNNPNDDITIKIKGN